MSINNRLLVLAPTRKGELVSVCARDLRWSEELTDDLVKTIMKVSVDRVVACGPVNNTAEVPAPVATLAALAALAASCIATHGWLLFVG